MNEHRIPAVSGKILIKWMISLGYRIVRQKGSHVRLEKSLSSGTHPITVPFHREIAKGTLNSIVDSISRTNKRDKWELFKELSRY